MTPNPAPDAVSDARMERVEAALRAFDAGDFRAATAALTAALSSPAATSPRAETKPTQAISVRKLSAVVDNFYGGATWATLPDGRTIHFDQSGNQNHMIGNPEMARAETGEGVDALVAKIEAKHGVITITRSTTNEFIVGKPSGQIYIDRSNCLGRAKTLLAALEAAAKDGK